MCLRPSPTVEIDPGNLEHPLVAEARRLAPAAPRGQRRILSIEHPLVYRLRHGRWRDATWLEAEAARFWLCAGAQREEGSGEDAYEIFAALHRAGRLLPDDDDRLRDELEENPVSHILSTRGLRTACPGSPPRGVRREVLLLACIDDFRKREVRCVLLKRGHIEQEGYALPVTEQLRQDGLTGDWDRLHNGTVLRSEPHVANFDRPATLIDRTDSNESLVEAPSFSFRRRRILAGFAHDLEGAAVTAKLAHGERSGDDRTPSADRQANDGEGGVHMLILLRADVVNARVSVQSAEDIAVYRDRGDPSHPSGTDACLWTGYPRLTDLFMNLEFAAFYLPLSIFSVGAFFLSLMFRAVAFCFRLPSFVARFVRLPLGLFDLRFVFF